MTMKRSTFLAVLLPTLVVALTLGRSATAQDASTPEPSAWSELEGAQQVVRRTYIMPNWASLLKINGNGIPAPDGEMFGLTGVVSVGGVIGQFDNSDNAAAAIDRVAEDTKRILERQPIFPTPAIEEVDVDLGDTSRAFISTQTIKNQSLVVSLLLIQQEEFVYGVMGSVIDGDAQELSTTFAQALIDNEAGDGESRFNEDGTSTGGLWDKFPNPDDALIANLAVSDEQLYPDVESTPAS